MPLCMRRAVRRTLRLGRSRARLISTSRGVANRRRCRPPSDVRRKARRSGGTGPRRGRSQLVPGCGLSALRRAVVFLPLPRGDCCRCRREELVFSRTDRRVVKSQVTREPLQKKPNLLLQRQTNPASRKLMRRRSVFLRILCTV